MTRIFISGPMSDVPELNKPAFMAAEEELKAEGLETFNPHSIVVPIKEHWQLPWTDEQIWLYCMRICVGQIPLCDRMHMLPHWQNSKGAVWEHRIASMLQLEITYAPVNEVPSWR